VVILRWFLAVLATVVSVTAGLAVLAVGLVALIFVTEPTQTGGSARIAGLGGNVTVIRDAHSIPHIFAETQLDAYRALGFVHAQDRFFQMELARRTAAGRLSEVVGPFGLGGDRFMRTLGVYRLAEATVATLTPEARAAVDAYAEGVNAWLSSPDTQRPAELIALGITPEPWRPADSAAWVRLMALLLAGDWRTEILKTQLSEFLSDEQLRDLWPDEPDGAPTTMALSSNMRKQITAIVDAVPDIFPEASASNEWVVSGDRSASGKPLLANDPHLGLSAPGMWHLARIVTPEFEASGGAIPGQPFFMVGQNGFLSWGLTTTHADTQDLFIERLDPTDPDRYLTPEGSNTFETRIEEIKVRGRFEPERLTVRTTRHGPVISDISSDARLLGGDGTVVSLAFAALREDDATANAIYGMNTAQTVPQFLAAASDFHAPMQNIAYAHIDGDFGFVSAGRLPIRPGGPGDRPRPGWTGQYDWDGFVPFDDLPRNENPVSGLLVNANNRVAPRDYPHVIANDWPEGFRASRILDLLAQTALHTPESFAAIQTDVVSRGARELTEAMLGTLSDEERNSSLFNEARKVGRRHGR
jgi:penicillin amidase